MTAEPPLSDLELRKIRALLADVRESEERAEESLAPAAPKLLAGLRIAVVDDDDDTLDVVGCILERQGAQVDRYPNAEKALAQVLIHRPSIVVSDIAMPGRGGLWLVKELRKVPTYRPAAVALSAHAMNQDRVDALTAGFDRHLAKPVNPDELVATVAAVGRPNGI